MSRSRLWRHLLPEACRDLEVSVTRGGKGGEGVRRRWPEGGGAWAARTGRGATTGGAKGGAPRGRPDRQQACCQRTQTDLNCFKPTNNNELPDKPCRVPSPPWRGPHLRAAPPPRPPPRRGTAQSRGSCPAGRGQARPTLDVSCQRSLLFAGVPAALTRAALTAAVGTGGIAEPERSIGHLTGNRAAQQLDA